MRGGLQTLMYPDGGARSPGLTIIYRDA